jgi:N-acetyl-beta-hexosaminidase
MVEQGNANTRAMLPEVEVEDWPATAYRGAMIDMSEGPFPTEAEVKRQIDFLARWKVNQYHFYSETSIALDGYSLLSANERFMQQQIREIVSYARERHIDVIPSLELFGHLHDLFRIEKYSSFVGFPSRSGIQSKGSACNAGVGGMG